jgi:hypothetical protein
MVPIPDIESKVVVEQCGTHHWLRLGQGAPVQLSNWKTHWQSAKHRLYAWLELLSQAMALAMQRACDYIRVE